MATVRFACWSQHLEQHFDHHGKAYFFSYLDCLWHVANPSSGTPSPHHRQEAVERMLGRVQAWMRLDGERLAKFDRWSQQHAADLLGFKRSPVLYRFGPAINRCILTLQQGLATTVQAVAFDACEEFMTRLRQLPSEFTADGENVTKCELTLNSISRRLPGCTWFAEYYSASRRR